MKTYDHFFYLTIWLLTLLTTFGCKKDDPPEGFTADFGFSFYNGGGEGGMAPDTGTFIANYPHAESYSWSVENATFTGKEITVAFQTAGSFTAQLTVREGEHNETRSLDFQVSNFPPGGTAMTIIQGNGEVGSLGVDGDAPFWFPIDTIDLSYFGGMDYDDYTKQLYYTGSVIRSFPNGAEKEVLFSDDQLAPWEDYIADLAVDPVDQHVYFAVNNAYFEGNISFVDFEGNNRTSRGTFSSHIRDITLNQQENRVYFTAFDNPSIFNLLVDFPDILYTSSNVKYAVAYDNSTEWLYFTEDFDFDGNHEIVRLNPATPGSEEVVVDNASAEPVLGLDILEAKQHLFWSDSKEKAIYRLDLNTPFAVKELIITGITNPRALAVGNFED